MGIIRSLIFLMLSGFLMVLFQNCGGGFEAGLLKVNSSNLGTVPDGSGDDLPSPMDISKSYIYMGSQNAIARGYVDHLDDTFHPLPDISMLTSGSVNWMEFDQENQKIFAVSSDSPNSSLNVYGLASDAEWTVDQSFSVAPGVVHFSMNSLGAGEYLGSTASYSQNIFEAHRFKLTDSTAANLTSVDFTPRDATAYRTHSSTLDTKSNLIYVANSDIGKVNIFQWDGNNIVTELGDIGGLINPRIVYYSKKFDLLYLVTENRTAASSVHIFKTTLDAMGALEKIEEVSSYQLSGDNGADLKIDYTNGYILATVRKIGASGVHFIPINDQGLIDLNGVKKALFVPSLEHPRSVSLSGDGKFVFLTYNVSNQEDLTILKVIYGVSGEILRTEKIGDFEMGGTSGYPSNMVIDQLNDLSFH